MGGKGGVREEVNQDLDVDGCGGGGPAWTESVHAV